LAKSFISTTTLHDHRHVQHYEGEQDRKLREQARTHPQEAKAGCESKSGWGRGGNWAFARKNQTIYMPLNTAWLRFRAQATEMAFPIRG